MALPAISNDTAVEDIKRGGRWSVGPMVLSVVFHIHTSSDLDPSPVAYSHSVSDRLGHRAEYISLAHSLQESVCTTNSHGREILVSLIVASKPSTKARARSSATSDDPRRSLVWLFVGSRSSPYLDAHASRHDEFHLEGRSAHAQSLAVQDCRSPDRGPHWHSRGCRCFGSQSLYPRIHVRYHTHGCRSHRRDIHDRYHCDAGWRRSRILAVDHSHGAVHRGHDAIRNHVRHDQGTHPVLALGCCILGCPGQNDGIRPFRCPIARDCIHRGF